MDDIPVCVLVFLYSPRLQVALVASLVLFLGTLLLGEYVVAGIHLTGALMPLSAVLQEEVHHKYRHAAWGDLLGSLLLLYRLFQKERRRIFGD